MNVEQQKLFIQHWLNLDDAVDPPDSFLRVVGLLNAPVSIKRAAWNLLRQTREPVTLKAAKELANKRRRKRIKELRRELKQLEAWIDTEFKPGWREAAVKGVE